jgi:uncharacterized protein
MIKPFTFGSISTGKDNFTDREEEIKRLSLNFQNGINTILISPRRWGKTSVVKRTAEVTNSNTLKIIYMDIFSCKDDKEFYDTYATNILRQTSNQWQEWVKDAKEFLSRLSPKISIGTDPTNDFSLSLSVNEKQESEFDILNLSEKIAKKKNIRIVVCIDEFQQILNFADNEIFQKKLRTVWQHHTNVSYCLFGSKKHLMSLLFEKKSLPFYKFGDIIYLQKIPQEDWVKYICNQFSKFGKHISKEFAIQICQTVDNHSSYVQQLSWLIFLRCEKEVNKENFDDAVEDLINQSSMLFQKDTEQLSLYQMNFMKALCSGVTDNFSTKQVMEKYNLGTTANVSRVKQALEQKELIDISNKKISLLDPIYKIWFNKNLLK